MTVTSLKRVPEYVGLARDAYRLKSSDQEQVREQVRGDASNRGEYGELLGCCERRAVALRGRPRQIDRATGTVFDPFLGVGVSGPLADQGLDKLPAFTAFPSDFDTFFPGGNHWPE